MGQDRMVVYVSRNVSAPDDERKCDQSFAAVEQTILLLHDTTTTTCTIISNEYGNTDDKIA